MKKLVLVAGLVLSQFAFAGSKTLGWTDSSDSIQATVVDALYNLLRIDSESKYPSNAVKITEDGELYIADGTNEVRCDSRSLGIMAVQSYQCTFSETDLGWTNSSNSVQAILFDALYKAKEFSSWIKSDINAGISVEFGDNVLTCESRAQGILTVQEYRCVLK